MNPTSQNGKKPEGPKRLRRSLIFYYVGLLLVVIVINLLFSRDPIQIDYSDFVKMLDEGKVAVVQLTQDEIAIKPSDKSSYCNAMPEVAFLRNARNVTVDVTDESGKVLRVLDQQDYVRKEVPIEQSILAEVNWNWIWHGTNYNKVTGRSESLPERLYYVNVRACADAKNAKQQLLTLPVLIDPTVPAVSATPVFTQGSTFQIEISAKDLGVVDSAI